MPSIPVLMHAKSDISTDDNLDYSETAKRRSKKSPEDRYLAASGPSKAVRKKKKVRASCVPRP
jgi:hypothetical protein